MSKWDKPCDIDEITFAFPAGVIGTLLPLMDEIPKEFKNRYHPICQFVTGLFFKGGTLPSVKDGIDEEKASTHLDLVLRSFQPKHEHKTYGAAYLMSLWYEFPPEEKK